MNCCPKLFDSNHNVSEFSYSPTPPSFTVPMFYLIWTNDVRAINLNFLELKFSGPTFFYPTSRVCARSHDLMIFRGLTL